MKHLGFDAGQTNDAANTIERIKMTEREGPSLMRDTLAFAIAS